MARMTRYVATRPLDVAGIVIRPFPAISGPPLAPRKGCMPGAAARGSLVLTPNRS